MRCRRSSCPSSSSSWAESVCRAARLFIERGRIQDRWRQSLISATGPLTNVLLAVVCTAPFWPGVLEGVPDTFRYALAFLALLQVTAANLHFLPVSDLDGYGVIEPWPSYGIRRQVKLFAPFRRSEVTNCRSGAGSARRTELSKRASTP